MAAFPCRFPSWLLILGSKSPLPCALSSLKASCYVQKNLLHIRYTRMAQPDAGILVVGDEVLKGHVRDTNSYFCCQKLYSWGVKVKKISVVPDSVDAIAQEISDLSKKYTYVITSGGIGPTHDDISYQGVAKGLGERLFLHPDLLKLMQKIFPNQIWSPELLATFRSVAPDDKLVDQIDPTLRMALVPESSVLHHQSNGDNEDQLASFGEMFPIIQVKNVYVLPGIPSYFERDLNFLKPVLSPSDCRFYLQEFFLNIGEFRIAALLQETVNRFGTEEENKVSIGCYPVLDNPVYATRLTIEAMTEASVRQASQFLIDRLPEKSIVSLEGNHTGAQNGLPPGGKEAKRLEELINSPEKKDCKLYRPVKEASMIIKECFEKYSPEEICVCFNGGKDCTALLHLVHLFRQILKIPSTYPLQAMYIICPDPFPEVEAFIEEAQKRYNLQLWSVPGPIKSGLGQFLKAHPQIKAMFMGNRKTDPYSDKLAPFQFTDPGWPPVMRVFPLLEWTYDDLWAFLRGFDVPYCSLYDEGYTSIGSRSNTHRNPALRRVKENGDEYYAPAYLLADGQVERHGRK